jgi:thioesterase domain-containing protein/acyl carrier protein
MYRVPSASLRSVRIESQLVQCWRDVLDVDKVGQDDDFFELGGDSLTAVELVAKMQRVIGANLPASVIYEAPTIRKLVVVLTRSQELPRPRLIDLRPAEPPRRPFFCVHGVGGEVTSVATLARHLGVNQPFFGIAASSRKANTSVTIEEMAAEYVQLVRNTQAHGPYCLGGYSMGGSIAYEMACQLHSHGEDVALLAILDHCPPPIRYRASRFTPSKSARFVGNFVRWTWDDVIASRAPSSGLPSLWSRLCRRVCHRVSPNEEANRVFDLSRLPEPIQTMVTSNYQALSEYLPSEYPGKVVLFRARTQPLFGVQDDDLGWKALARGGVEVVRVPGNHDTCLREPHVFILARELDRRLQQVAVTIS